MVRDLSSIVIQSFGERQITVNRIINSSILNFVLNSFDYNDKIHQANVHSIYNYGPKTFLKQLSTETGNCQIDSSFPFIDYLARTKYLLDDRNLSGYQYGVKGYKIWANTATTNDSLLSSELQNSKLITQQINNTYKTISCDLTANIYDNLNAITEPEIYDKITDNDLLQPTYLSRVTTINPYYISNEIEKQPSVWKGEYHNTYDYTIISNIIDTYIKWHENIIKDGEHDGHDKYGCYDHSTDSAQFFKGKMQKELFDDSSANNFQSLTTNAHSNIIISCFSGNTIQTAKIQNPQTACINTSPIPLDSAYNGYEITHKMLQDSYDKNIISKEITFVWNYILYANGTFKLFINMSGFDNIYINDITNKSIDKSLEFSSNNGASNGNKTLVFYNLPLAPAAANVSFNTYIANISYNETSNVKYSDGGRGFLKTDYNNLYKSLVNFNGDESGQNILPKYCKGDSVRHLIVSSVQYSTPNSIPFYYYSTSKDTYYANHKTTILRKNYFDSKGALLATQSSDYNKCLVGSSSIATKTDSGNAIIGVCGPENEHQAKGVVFKPLTSIGYDNKWTRTIAKFNLYDFIQTNINNKDLKTSTKFIPLIQAVSVAQKRYQFGDDNAKYVQTKITNAKLKEFTIEMFNSEEQELMITGSWV